MSRKSSLFPAGIRQMSALLLTLHLLACSSPKKAADPMPEKPRQTAPRQESPRQETPGPGTPRKPQASSTRFTDLMATRPDLFKPILENPESYRVQAIWTHITRDGQGKPHFEEHQLNTVPPDTYFYPASTVKMPTALLALQRVRELGIPGLDRNSTMITGAEYSGQSPVQNDPTAWDGRPSIAQYVRKIFLVSDNDAFNRLYEFLGPSYINKELHDRGYAEAQIQHRLEISLTEDENRHTNPIAFYDTSGVKLYEQPMQLNRDAYPRRDDALGKGYYKNDVLYQGPMDFSRKNRLSLNSLNQILKSIMFPESVPAKQRFRVSDDDLAFVRKYMSMVPSAAKYPPYDGNEFWDTYCKFLYFGSEKDARIPPTLKVFNKVGDAYGYLLDIAYFKDDANGVEFMLSAVIYCNSDGILNDSRYDYDTIGFPFMKNLGKLIYDEEVKMK